MSDWLLYDKLVAEANEKLVSPWIVEEVIVGISWTVTTVRQGAATSTGICYSPKNAARTLPWSGSLVGRTVTDLFSWLYEWEGTASAIGVSTLNAIINHNNKLISQANSIPVDAPAHLKVFHYFKDHLVDQNVCVIGRYPGLSGFDECARWQVIERTPQADDFPDTAGDYLLPQADWVFVTASSIANKSLPRLLKAAQHATIVLMGPSLPWSVHWKAHGVDYLAGVTITSPLGVIDVAKQAGGTRLFEMGCEYRILSL